MVERVVHLGFEVRVELVLARRRARSAVQLTRAEAEELELDGGDIVCVRRPRRRGATRQRAEPAPPGRRAERARSRRGSSPAREVGERDVLDDRAQARAHARSRLCCSGSAAPAYSTSSGRLAADAGQRALDGADDVGDA